jgi:hypothetical protein
VSKKKKDDMVPLGRVLAKYEDDAVKMRFALDDLNAKFPSGNAEVDAERKKVAKLVEMILQHHQRAAAGAIKMLILGIIEGKHREAVDVLKMHLAQIESTRDALTMVRARFMGDQPEPEGPKIEVTSEEGLKKQTGLRILRPGDEN